MTTTTAPAPEAVADVLDKAAGIVDTNGLIKGQLYDGEQADQGTPRDQCRVCTIGAINVAVFGTPRAADPTVEQISLIDSAADAVAMHLGLGIGFVSLPSWNDADTTTDDNVKAVLRATAASLRGEGK